MPFCSINFPHIGAGNLIRIIAKTGVGEPALRVAACKDCVELLASFQVHARLLSESEEQMLASVLSLLRAGGLDEDARFGLLRAVLQIIFSTETVGGLDPNVAAASALRRLKKMYAETVAELEAEPVQEPAENCLPGHASHADMDHVVGAVEDELGAPCTPPKRRRVTKPITKHSAAEDEGSEFREFISEATRRLMSQFHPGVATKTA